MAFENKWYDHWLDSYIVVFKLTITHMAAESLYVACGGHEGASTSRKRYQINHEADKEVITS